MSELARGGRLAHPPAEGHRPEAGLAVRLARPEEYARLGEICVAAYRSDGVLSEHYARSLRDVADRARSALVLAAELAAARPPEVADGAPAELVAGRAPGGWPGQQRGAEPHGAQVWHLAGTVTLVLDGPYAELADPTAGEAEFRMLAVAPHLRRRGVAEALVGSCLERARAAGRTRMVLCTQPSMLAAQHLYARVGFRRAPERDLRPVPEVLLWAYTLPL